MDRLVDNIRGKVIRGIKVKRLLDELGRVVLPIEFRRELKIGMKDEIELLVDEDNLVIKKFLPRCVFCHKNKDTIIYKNKVICKECFEELKKI